MLGPDHFLLLGELSLKAVEGFDKKHDVLHVLNTKGLANTVNLDGELFLKAGSFTTLERSVVYQILSLVYQYLEDILYFLIFGCVVRLVRVIKLVVCVLGGLKVKVVFRPSLVGVASVQVLLGR